MKFKISTENHANSCYFRTSVKNGHRKALIKITERCNLKCAHCFVSSGKEGMDITLEDFQKYIIPALISSRVISVTLTGGEPFVHPNILEIIESIDRAGMTISICTNGYNIDKSIINELTKYKNLTVNVSLDGFSEKSHGKFRGNEKSFNSTIETIKRLSELKLFKGILSTPNMLTNVKEYNQLAKFAIDNNAKYLLMNPLGSMGRGEKSEKSLKLDDENMVQIYNELQSYSDDIEIVDIRFPNEEKPLASCEAGNIIYIFTNGDVTVCPYLAFATKTKVSKYHENTFITSNVFRDNDTAEKLDNFNIYKSYPIGDNQKCKACHLNSECGKGCPAEIISSGQYINGVDNAVCPIK